MKGGTVSVPAQSGSELESWIALRMTFPQAARRFRRIYVALDWIWQKGPDGERHVPTEVEIEAAMHDLCDRAMKGPDGRQRCDSGGLSVWRDGNECGVSFIDDGAVVYGGE